MLSGADILHVPYKGMVPAATDVMGGNVPILFGNSLVVLPAVQERQAARHRYHHAPQEQHRPRAADDRRVRLPGLRVGHLVRTHGARAHAARHRDAAERRRRAGRAASRTCAKSCSRRGPIRSSRRRNRWASSSAARSRSGARWRRRPTSAWSDEQSERALCRSAHARTQAEPKSDPGRFRSSTSQRNRLCGVIGVQLRLEWHRACSRCSTTSPRCSTTWRSSPRSRPRRPPGVLGDDLALNAQQVAGVRAERELPVVWAVAKGSLVNKAILVPAALAISALAPWAVMPLLMVGGAFLCYEGFEKLAHKFLHGADEDDAHHAELARARRRSRARSGGAREGEDQGRRAHRLHPVGRDHRDHARHRRGRALPRRRWRCWSASPSS